MISESTIAPAGSDISFRLRDYSFPDYPGLPQLQTAANPSSMLEVLQRRLKPGPGKHLELQECIPGRFRLSKRGSRITCQYTLRVMDPDRGQALCLPIVAVIYSELSRAQEIWTELKASHPPDAVPARFSTFEPLTLIPELQMLVYVFPYDRCLRNLPELLAGPWPELLAVFQSRFGEGYWQIVQQTAEPLRYLAEETAVIRYVVEARDSAGAAPKTWRFYSKIYRTRHGEATWQLLRHLPQDAETLGFTVAEPVTYCSQRRCLVLAEARGSSLQSVLESSALGSSPAYPTNGQAGDSAAPVPNRDDSSGESASQLMRRIRAVARAMAAFNQAKIPAIKHHSAEEQVRFLTAATDLLGWACPGSARLLDQIVADIRKQLRDVPAVPIQWDLKVDHIFLENDKVTFIDQDTVSLGDPARDPAHLAAQIACRIDTPQISSELAREAADALIEEYFSLVPAGWRSQLTLQYVIAVLETACGLFKRQEQRWAERAAAAILDAHRALAAGL
jgi:hypothetical protein